MYNKLSFKAEAESDFWHSDRLLDAQQRHVIVEGAASHSEIDILITTNSSESEVIFQCDAALRSFLYNSWKN